MKSLFLFCVVILKMMWIHLIGWREEIKNKNKKILNVINDVTLKKKWYHKFKKIKCDLKIWFKNLFVCLSLFLDKINSYKKIVFNTWDERGSKWIIIIFLFCFFLFFHLHRISSVKLANLAQTWEG